MPLVATRGAASAQGFGEFAQQTAANYIEDVFSTWLYTGNGSTQTITTGIDLAGKGGMLWIKNRSSATNNIVNDTARGAGKNLMTNSTSAEFTNTDNVSALSSTGFSVGVDSNTNGTAGNLYASWTFREQPKFFDVVTYTGNGTAGRQIAHNLGSVPGCIIVKCTSETTSWRVYHRSLGATKWLQLQATDAADTDSSSWNDTAPTSTHFTVGNVAAVNGGNGQTYVAYLFAHDAGGFGLTGTDNVISCGSFTTNGSGQATVSLGYEPQWLLWKRSDSDSNWLLLDNMRSWNVGGNDFLLRPNLSDAESTGSNYGFPTATGFYMENMVASATYIYIAIRRGPMKTPTTGTSVFSPTLQAANSTAQTKVYGFVTDSVWALPRNQNGYNNSIWSRLQGPNVFLSTALTSAENTSQTTALIGFDVQDGVRLGADTGSWIQATANWVHYPFRRAPGFFDVVCYTGTGSATTQAHNLGVVPELMIVKRRNAGSENDWWPVYSKAPFNDPAVYQLNTTSGAFGLASVWNSTNPTASVFSVGTSQTTNASGGTYVAYLFASCPGVSKCGSYTGTGALQTIDCGFTGGARFVLIKRYDNTGDWWVYDSARGISSGNDPYLFLNSTAAEVTGTNYVDTTSVGFRVTAAAPAGLNANGGTFIFLAIA